MKRTTTTVEEEYTNDTTSSTSRVAAAAPACCRWSCVSVFLVASTQHDSLPTQRKHFLVGQRGKSIQETKRTRETELMRLLVPSHFFLPVSPIKANATAICIFNMYTHARGYRAPPSPSHAHASTLPTNLCNAIALANRANVVPRFLRRVLLADPLSKSITRRLFQRVRSNVKEHPPTALRPRVSYDAGGRLQ